MSFVLLSDPNKIHDLLDDLESLFWVYVWGAAQYVGTDAEFTLAIKDFDDKSLRTVKGKTQFYGGAKKATMLREMAFANIPFTCAPLKDLIATLSREWVYFHRAREDLLVPGGRAAELAWEAKQKQLIDPSFWIAKFDDVLKRDDWKSADIVSKRFPSEKRQSATQAAEELRFTTILGSESISILWFLDPTSQYTLEDEDYPNDLDVDDILGDRPLSPLPTAYGSDSDSGQDDTAIQPPRTVHSTQADLSVESASRPSAMHSKKRTMTDREELPQDDPSFASPLTKRTKKSSTGEELGHESLGE